MKKRENKKRGKTVSRVLFEESREYFKKYKNNNTRKSYTNDYRKFIVFCRENYNCKTKEECGEHIQDYADFLIEKKYKASTIHTYLAAVCIYHSVHLKDVEKPKRVTSEYTRGRKDNNKKKRADNNLKNLKYERTVEFQSVVGIRRNELRKLKGEDLVIDESGHMCVYVKRGKGGKPQLQRILPEDRDFVKGYFEKVKESERIFKAEEFENNIPYHTLRAYNAQRVYDYYIERLKSEPEAFQKELENEIRLRWQLYNLDKKTGKPKRLNPKLIEGQYLLRGKTKEFAKKNNLPIEYSKLALMAVSIFHLSHWRLDVTVASYMLVV